MDARASGFVAAEWDRIRSDLHKGKLTEDMLHRSIVEVLITSCFYCDENIHFAREKLTLAMPRFHHLIRKVNLKRQIKLVKETAIKISCPLGNRYLYVKDVVSNKTKKVFNELNLLFEAALIVLFSMEHDRLVICGINLFENVDKFLEVYSNASDFPHDSSFDHFEKFKLFQFANYMKIIIYLLNKAEGHRDHAVELAVRITEGRHARYTFGSGSPKRGLASPSLRRKSVYWREGDVIPKRNERHRKRFVNEFLFDEVGLNTDEKSQVLLDHLTPPNSDIATCKRKSHRFMIQEPLTGEEYIVVWEAKSSSGELCVRVCTAVRRTVNAEGNVIEHLLGRTLFLSYPLELSQDELTGPFFDECDLREVVDDITENATECVQEIASVLYSKSDVFTQNNVVMKIADTYNALGMEVKQISISNVKAFSPLPDQQHALRILASGEIGLAPLESMIEDRGGAAATFNTGQGSFLSNCRPLQVGGMQGMGAGLRRRADGSAITDQPMLSSQSSQGCRLLSSTSHPYCTSNIKFARETAVAPAVFVSDFADILRMNNESYVF